MFTGTGLCPLAAGPLNTGHLCELVGLYVKQSVQELGRSRVMNQIKVPQNEETLGRKTKRSETLPVTPSSHMDPSINVNKFRIQDAAECQAENRNNLIIYF